LISGDANDFQYPNTFTIDFSPSAYTTRQQVYDLRFAAGDTNVIWPDAEQWGSTDFTYTYKCIWRGDNGTDTRLFSVGQSGSLIEAYRVNGTNNFFFRVRDDVAAESGIAVALPSLIQYGDSLTLALAYSSVAGLTATANGVTEVNATTVGAITLNPFLRLNGYGHLAQGPNSNIEIFKVTDDS
ncbi:MAG: hypothetical protein GY804_11780, partial [Alphaproteobacteria bacterium]|nr:hypothetical protein [Alphaproteobacteria bacterium]